MFGPGVNLPSVESRVYLRPLKLNSSTYVDYDSVIPDDQIHDYSRAFGVKTQLPKAATENNDIVDICTPIDIRPGCDKPAIIESQ